MRHSFDTSPHLFATSQPIQPTQGVVPRNERLVLFGICRVDRAELATFEFVLAGSISAAIARTRKVHVGIVVAAQAVLGSDYKREAYNVMRVQNLDAQSPYWRARWNVLYSMHAKPER